jgi:hypothetical protein
MSTMVVARFDSVPMARSAAHALVADGFAEESISMFYGQPRMPRARGGLRAWLAGWRRGQVAREILLVLQLYPVDVQAAMSLLRDAGSVYVEQSQDSWQAGHAPYTMASLVKRPRPAAGVELAARR